MTKAEKGVTSGLFADPKKVAQIKPKSALSAELAGSEFTWDNFTVRYTSQGKSEYGLAPIPTTDGRRTGQYLGSLMLSASRRTEHPVEVRGSSTSWCTTPRSPESWATTAASPPPPRSTRRAGGHTPYMDRNHYRFRTVWTLSAPAATVYGVLERIEDYPRWWPQVREVARLDDTTGIVTIRSVLPYDLTFTLREGRRDRENGVLEAGLSGDIDGWARWTVTDLGAHGCLAHYEQEVDVRARLLRLLAVPGRPLFRANHALMLRAGRRGLAAHLEAV